MTTIIIRLICKDALDNAPDDACFADLVFNKNGIKGLFETMILNEITITNHHTSCSRKTAYM